MNEQAPAGWPKETKEPAKTYNVTIRVDQETHKRLGELADAARCSRAQVVIALLRHPRAIELLDEVEVEQKQWRIEHRGKALSANGWSRELGIPVSTILYRLNKGLPIEEVLSTTPLSGNKGRVALRFEDQFPNHAAALRETAGHSKDEWV